LSTSIHDSSALSGITRGASTVCWGCLYNWCLTKVVWQE
jgi:hypothetical protein